jgi:drug/metabolite transporter (DMT)-like permease
MAERPQIMPRRPWLGASLVLLSGVFWATYVITAKLAIEFGLDVFTINLFRLGIGAAVLGLFVLAFRRFSSKTSIPLLFLILFLGAIDHGLGGLLYIGSLAYIEASLAYLLVYAYPAMVVVVAALAGRERITAKKVLAVITTFIGVALVLEVGGAVKGEEWIGVAFVLSSALIFSVYLICCEGLMDRYSSSQISFLSLAGGAVGLLTLLPFAPLRIDLAGTPDGLLLLAMIGIVGTALALLFFLMGVRHTGASTASIITTAEPAFVVILAWFFLGETLSLIQFLGMVFLVVGVAIVQWGEKAYEPGP